MYAIVRKYKTTPGAVSTQMQSILDRYVPIVSQMPGFVAYYAVDTGNDTAAITIWEDQAAAEATHSVSADYVKQHHTEHVLGEPEVIAGEVHIFKTR